MKEHSFIRINNRGVKIDFSKSATSFWDTCSSMNIFVYSGGDVAQYIIVSEASRINAFAGYIGVIDCLDIKLDTINRMLYCFPKNSSDCSMEMQITGYRNYKPTITEITNSEFQDINGTTIIAKSMI